MTALRFFNLHCVSNTLFKCSTKPPLGYKHTEILQNSGLLMPALIAFGCWYRKLAFRPKPQTTNLGISVSHDSSPPSNPADMIASGFSAAPVSKFLFFSLITSSILVSITDTKHLFYIQVLPHLYRYKQLWRLLIWQVKSAPPPSQAHPPPLLLQIPVPDSTMKTLRQPIQTRPNSSSQQ